jgi:cytochrome b561
LTHSNRYTAVAISLHWLIAVLIVGMVFFGWQADDLRQALFAGDQNVDPQQVALLFNWHKTIGLLILALSLFRLVWRFLHPAPPLPSGMAGWEKLAATGTHWAFYALMIGMPLGGWVAASASGFPSYLFNMETLAIPSIAPESEALHQAAGWAHSKGAWAILALLALHIGAALKHHFVNRDDVLSRMIVFLRPKG